MKHFFFMINECVIHYLGPIIVKKNNILIENMRANHLIIDRQSTNFDFYFIPQAQKHQPLIALGSVIIPSYTQHKPQSYIFLYKTSQNVHIQVMKLCTNGTRIISTLSLKEKNILFFKVLKYISYCFKNLYFCFIII